MTCNNDCSCSITALKLLLACSPLILSLCVVLRVIHTDRASFNFSGASLMMMLYHWLVISLCSVSHDGFSSLLMLDVNNSLFKYLVLFMHQMHLYISLCVRWLCFILFFF